MRTVLKNSKGVTIPELLVVISVLAILSASFLVLMTNFLTTSSRANARSQLTIQNQEVIRDLTNEAILSSGVRTNSTISDANMSGGWTTDNSNFTLVVTLPATNKNTHEIIADVGGQPLLNEFVYFLDGTTLYKRTLANPSASDNRYTTSCPEAAVSPSCPVDRILAKDVSSLSYTLYGEDHGIVTSTPSLARALKLDLTLTKTIGGSNIDLSDNIWVAFRNDL